MNNNLLGFNTCAYIPQMDIASRLDQAMHKAGYKTQQALADASGVPQPTIARILKGNGKRGPESETVKKLANSCGVSFSWLMEGKEPDQYIKPVPAPVAIKQPVQDYEKLSLSYISSIELELLTHYRQSTTESRELIIRTAAKAPKDRKKLNLTIKSV
ncbi:helix-turn-helix domain-containing protein [Undibacterium macrobrachii]|nr:helix-turn-helix domain-containing protein [Undibacterium macrobrachii]